MYSRLVLATLILVGTLMLTSCGGESDERSEGARTAATTATAASSPVPTRPLDAHRERLRAAGIEFEDEESSDAADSLETDTGVGIAAWSTSDEAADSGSEISQIFEEAPSGRGLVRVHDTRVYTLARERKLTADELAGFADVVRASEGK